MNKEQLEILKTVLVIVGITLCLVWFLSMKSDVFTGEKERYYSRAEFICWSTGSYGGVDEFTKTEEGFHFTCDDSEMDIEYDISKLEGWIDIR